MAEEIPGLLGGEAHVDSWHFDIGQGPIPDLIGHTFPLIAHDAEGRWELVGTGFYVSSNGLFVTAKHNIEHVFDPHGKQAKPLVIVHFYSSTGMILGEHHFLLRPIDQCWIGDQADIALGAAAVPTNNETGVSLTNLCWPLSWSVPPIGMDIGTLAFPRHAIETLPDRHQVLSFASDLYRGNVEQVGDRRDRVMVPYPYLQLSCRIHGAASGGPILLIGGTVVGVNATELPPFEEIPSTGYGVQIRCLQNAFLDGAESGPIEFSKLVERRVITARGFVPDAIPPQAGRVVFLTMPVAAPSPQIVNTYRA